MFAYTSAWGGFKDWLANSGGVTHWDLHIIVGLLGFVIFAKLLGRPFTSAIQLIPLAALELANEILDFELFRREQWPWPAGTTAIEVFLTLGPPALLMFFLRGRAGKPEAPLNQNEDQESCA